MTSSKPNMALGPDPGWAGSALLVRAAVVLAASYIIRVLWRGFRIRMMFRRLRSSGLPMMPHSLLWGHIPTIIRLTSDLPRDMHPNYVPQLILMHWMDLFPAEVKQCPGAFYIDTWPLGPPILFTVSASMAEQFLQHEKPTLPKAAAAAEFLRPLTGCIDLVCSEGSVWRAWRSRLNPGFSSRNVTALVPAMLDEVLVFVGKLRKSTEQGKHREGGWSDVFLLEDMTMDLTIDIIGRVVLDLKLNEQTSGPGVFRKAMSQTLHDCLFDYNVFTFFTWINPWRLYRLRRNERLMSDFLLPHIRDKIRRNQRPDNRSDIDCTAGAPRTQSVPAGAAQKTVVDLAVKTYLKEAAAATSQPLEDDSTFTSTIVSQLKVFMFAGHDTTATSICWILFCLLHHSDPSILTTLREEHASVLGPDPKATIRTSPHLLLGSALPYTHAVIKEALRIYPAVGSIRDGLPSVVLTDSNTGHVYPTENCMVWDGIRAAGIVHPSRSSSKGPPDGWVRPLEFLPERFLPTTKPSDPLYPPKHGWRIFGLGPRACIGQELALTEMKLVLVLLLLEFDLRIPPGGFATLQGRSSSDGWTWKMAGIVNENVLYQCGKGMPHVKDRMPAQVRLRRNEPS